MIRFGRKETTVTVKIEHGIWGADHYFELEVNQSQDYQAELLRRAFQDNLNKHLAAIKEKYYREGWKAAKAKIKKRTDFYGGWEK